MLLYIIPTYQCNLNCQSCYSQKYKTTYSECMSWAKFVKVYDKFCDTLDRVVLIGGEAVMWKFINEAIMFLKNKNIKVSLFTNGVDIASAMPDRVVINANNLLNKYYFDNISKNIDIYKRNKVRITLRYNINQSFEAHVVNAVDLAKLYADSVSLSVLFPFKHNDKLTGEITCDLARKLMSNGIKTQVSRATPLCLFTEENRIYLETNCNMHGVCSLPTNSLVINPDGISCQPCVELPIVKNINSSLETSIKESFRGDINSIKNKILTECKGCNFLAQKKCFGGCLAYK